MGVNEAAPRDATSAEFSLLPNIGDVIAPLSNPDTPAKAFDSVKPKFSIITYTLNINLVEFPDTWLVFLLLAEPAATVSCASVTDVMFMAEASMSPPPELVLANPATSAALKESEYTRFPANELAETPDKVTPAEISNPVTTKFTTGGDLGAMVGFLDGECVGILVRLRLGAAEGWSVGWLEGGLDGCPDGSRDGWLEGGLDGCPDGSTDGWPEGGSDGCPDGSTDGWPEGGLDGCPDGSTVGWPEG